MSQKIEPVEHGKYYHIYNRGINGENLFREKDNYIHFLNLYDKYIEHIAETSAWCLMPNHFHLLVRIKDEDEIDFIPRKSNIKLLRSRITMKNIVFIDFDDEEHLGFTKMYVDKYNYISLNWLEDFASIYRDGIKNSYVGMLIEVLKSSSFVIGRCDKFASKLGLLLGVPLITINDETSWDAISLINPQNTSVIKCENFSEGVSAYEDNF